MLIPIRVLKRKIVQFSTRDKGPLFDPVLQLFQPSFEPFLLMRIRFRNIPGPPYSLQFVKEMSSEYHYMNFEFNKQESEGKVLSYVAVAEVPLQPDCNWHVLKFMPDGSSKGMGEISRDAYGLWHYKSNRSMISKEDDNSEKQHGCKKYILIGGAPKSGTTWVERIVNSHPDALATGENVLFSWPRRGKLNALMESGPPPYFAMAVPQRPPFRSQAALMYAGRAQKTLMQIAEIAQVDTVADKSPQYGVFLPEILATLPDWNYIHCIRNPLDVMVSRFFHERNILIDTPILSLLPNDNSVRSHVLEFDVNSTKGDMFANLAVMDFMADASIEGYSAIDIGKKLRSVHLVYYEDLLGSFNVTTGDIYDFCGLNSDVSLIKEIKKCTSFESFSGGRKAGDENKREFFRKGVSGDYLNYMTTQQIEYAIRRIAFQTDCYRRYFESLSPCTERLGDVVDKT